MGNEKMIHGDVKLPAKPAYRRAGTAWGLRGTLRSRGLGLGIKIPLEGDTPSVSKEEKHVH